MPDDSDVVEWEGSVLRITRNETDVSLLGFPVDCAKVSAKRQVKRLADGSKQIYWRCSYEFHFGE